MSDAIQIRSGDAMAEWSVIRSQSEVLVKTGFLPQSIKTPEQAMAIVLTGRELGIGTMAALNTINVIQGKPTISPQLMLALINRSGQLEDISIDAAPDGATVMMKRRGRSPYTAHFGHKEASAMGLLGKDNYKKQPATMYKWRAVADAARVVFPDVVLGIYSPDEMGAEVDTETGAIIEMPADEPAETDPKKLAFNAQSPLSSQISTETRRALGEAITVLRDLGMSLEEIRAEMQAATGADNRDRLTEEQGRGMLSIYHQMAEELRAERGSTAIPTEAEILF